MDHQIVLSHVAESRLLRLTSAAKISTIFAKLNLTFLNFANICTHASYGALQNLASTSLELIKMI